MVKGGERLTDMQVLVSNCVMIVSFTFKIQILLSFQHNEELTVSTITAICHCCIYIPIYKDVRRWEKDAGTIQAD